jgi:hypothetical protein
MSKDSTNQHVLCTPERLIIGRLCYWASFTRVSK